MYSTKRSQIKIKKVDLGNFIFKYDAIKVICNKNRKGPRNFGHIGSFGDMGTYENLAKNREIA